MPATVADPLRNPLPTCVTVRAPRALPTRRVRPMPSDAAPARRPGRSGSRQDAAQSDHQDLVDDALDRRRFGLRDDVLDYTADHPEHRGGDQIGLQLAE